MNDFASPIDLRNYDDAVEWQARHGECETPVEKGFL